MNKSISPWEVVRKIEEVTQNQKYVSADVLSDGELEFAVRNPLLFFAISSTRITLTYRVIAAMREVFEENGRTSIDIPVGAYEALRVRFDTKTFSKTSLYGLFASGSNNTGILTYEDFLEIEKKTTEEYNNIAPNEMKLPTIHHIYVPIAPADSLKQELQMVVKAAKHEETFHKRATGRTLESLGRERGVTRERARQMVSKPRILVENWLNKRKTEIIAHLGGPLIDGAKAKEYFGAKYWDSIKYTVRYKEPGCCDWEYIEHLDTICGEAGMGETIESLFVNAAEFHRNYNDLKKELVQELPVTEDMVDKYMESKKYHVYVGKVYDHKLNVKESIVEAALVYDGIIKVTDDEKLTMFAKFLTDNFGLKISTNRSLMTRIQDVLIMSDSATYVHPSTIKRSARLEEEVKNYLNSIDSDRCSYDAAFSVLSDEAKNEANVHTVHTLHSYIKRNESEIGLTPLRYYICHPEIKDKKSAAYFKPFADWLKEEGPKTEAEIMNRFDGWTNWYPKYAMLYYPEIVQWGNGMFANVETFHCNFDGVESILEDATKNKLHYTNSSLLYEMMRKRAPGFFKPDENGRAVETENQMFHVLRNRFKNDERYSFCKPHIRRGKYSDFSTEQLIGEIVGKYDKVDKEFIYKSAEKYYGPRNSSLCLAIQKYLSDYVRIGASTYIKPDKFVVTQEMMDAVDALIARNIDTEHKYVIASQISEFEGLPEASFEWNSWTICAVAKKSGKYNVLFEKRNSRKNTAVITEGIEFKTQERFAAYLVENVYKGELDNAPVNKFLRSMGVFPQAINAKKIIAMAM